MNGLGALQNYVTGGEVTQAYRDILGRLPDSGGLQFYTNPNLSLADLKAQLAGSTEGRAFLASQAPTGSAAAMQAGNTMAPGTMGAGVQPTTVADLYTKYLGREADAGGLASWTKQFGPTVDANELNRFLEADSTKKEMAKLPLQQLNTSSGNTAASQGSVGPAVPSGFVSTNPISTNVPAFTVSEIPTNTTPLVSLPPNDGGTVIDTSGSAGKGNSLFNGLNDKVLQSQYGKDIDSLFESLLGRTPTADDYTYYGKLLRSGTPLEQVKSDIGGTKRIT